MKNTRRTEVSYYLISLIISICLLIWIMQLWSAPLDVPFTYSGDALFESVLIKGMIETGWIFQNPSIGMPSGFLSYDYPAYNFLDFFIMKIISIFFPNWSFTMNIFFLLTFPLTTITTLFVFRKLNISIIPAIVGSLLFTFVPFHFLRGEPHLVLSSYFLVPLIVLVIFWIFDDDILLSHFKKESWNLHSLILNSKTLISITICIGIALEYVYYPFFSCFFLFIAGICTTLLKRKWSPLLNAGLFIFIIALCIFITILPTILYQQDTGKNVEVAIRSPAESEIYGLKIIQLLLPVSGHRITFFSHISELYSRTFPLVNENSTAALGIVGSIGFCLLILWIFYQLFTQTSINNGLLRKIHELSVLNLSAVLLATIGGFGTIIAYLIFPQIRCYNRISIFISFFCIAAIVILLECILQKYSTSKTKKWMVIGLISIVLLVGLYDQTSEHFVPDYNNTKIIFINDQNFIKNIEETFPNDTMVFQLPYVPFPENPPVNQMADYDHFRGYLHSENIHWSYGAMRGREGDLWQREIVNKPMNDIVNNLSYAGFQGIYVDSYGYPDNGNETISLLSSIFQISPIISENNRLYFFDMTNYNNQLIAQWTPEEFKKEKEKVIDPLQYEWHSDFSDLESSRDTTWRWCSSQGTLVITNPTNNARIIILQTTLFSGHPEYSQLKIESSNGIDTISINNEGSVYQNEFKIPPGRSTISFICDAQRVYAPGDPRYLVFRMENTQIIERSS